MGELAIHYEALRKTRVLERKHQAEDEQLRREGPDNTIPDYLLPSYESTCCSNHGHKHHHNHKLTCPRHPVNLLQLSFPDMTMLRHRTIKANRPNDMPVYKKTSPGNILTTSRLNRTNPHTPDYKGPQVLASKKAHNAPPDQMYGLIHPDFGSVDSHCPRFCPRCTNKDKLLKRSKSMHFKM